MREEQSPTPSALSESELRNLFERTDYIADDRTVTTVQLALQLGRPLLVEGPPGSGKTELGKTLAEGFDTELIRLQCYEGLTAENALYEWNYTKQLLAVQAGEGTVSAGDPTAATPTTDAPDGQPAVPESVFGESFLLERPLLRALRADGDRPPVLLIDEVDRADQEFEAFLLELLSDFQVTIPELGTVEATHPPIVILTSNRTRGLSDALKRRCLYLHVEPPGFETEYEIVRRKVPELDAAVAAAVCAVVERLREESFLKQPGVAETLDWARAVAMLRADGSPDRTGGLDDGDPNRTGGLDDGDPNRTGGLDDGDPNRTGGLDDGDPNRTGGLDDGDPNRTGGSDDGDPPEASLTPAEIERTLGCLLKEAEDIGSVDTELLERLHEAAQGAATRVE